MTDWLDIDPTTVALADRPFHAQVAEAMRRRVAVLGEQGTHRLSAPPTMGSSWDQTFTPADKFFWFTDFRPRPILVRRAPGGLVNNSVRIGLEGECSAVGETATVRAYLLDRSTPYALDASDGVLDVDSYAALSFTTNSFAWDDGTIADPPTTAMVGPDAYPADALDARLPASMRWAWLHVAVSVSTPMGLKLRNFQFVEVAP